MIYQLNKFFNHRVLPTQRGTQSNKTKWTADFGFLPNHFLYSITLRAHVRWKYNDKKYV
jgi:hypothetical protein